MFDNNPFREFKQMMKENRDQVHAALHAHYEKRMAEKQGKTGWEFRSHSDVDERSQEIQDSIVDEAIKRVEHIKDPFNAIDAGQGHIDELIGHNAQPPSPSEMPETPW